MHAFYRRCSEYSQEVDATCNCAVAVRVDDDVVVLDRCGPTVAGKGSHALQVHVYNNGDLSSGLRVLRIAGGIKYEVRTRIIHVLRINISQCHTCIPRYILGGQAFSHTRREPLIG